MNSPYIWFAGGIGLGYLTLANIAQAQIVIDGSTPNTSIAGDCENHCTIDGGIIGGKNLFHSFDRFNVSQGATVLFADPGVINIFSRVSGGEISNILGTLGVSGGDANLFFLNPTGIIFGPGARLDVNGSFVATTANGIEFGSQGSFFASPQTQENLALLTVNPSAFFFEQMLASGEGNPISLNPGANLSVPPEQNLVLLSANNSAAPGIVFEGATIQAPQGRVELGAVAGKGSVSIASDFQLDFSSTTEKTDIILSDRASIDVSGLAGGTVSVLGADVTLTEESSIIAHTLGNLAGGGIFIQAGNLQLENDSFISTLTFGEGTGGSIDIKVLDSIKIIGSGSAFFQEEFIISGLNGNLSPDLRLTGLLTGTTGSGNAGNINLTTSNLAISDGSVIFAPTFGIGRGGNLAIQAREQLTVSDSGIVTSTLVGSSGTAGDLTIQAGKLAISNGAFVSTSTLGTGNGGQINVRASESIEISTTPPGAFIPTGIYTNTILGTGDAGNLTIDTQKLTILGGGIISSASGARTSLGFIRLGGRGGDIIINSSDSTEVSGVSADGLFVSGIDSSTLSNGNAGNLLINTDRLKVSDRAVISSATSGTGDGGNLTINAIEAVEVSGAGFESLQQGIAMNLNGTLESSALRVGLLTGTNNIGVAGNLTINTKQLLLTDGGGINTTTFGEGNAGNLTINASESVEVVGSGLASGTFSNGNAGNFTINTQRLIVRDGSVLSTSTVGDGRGGKFDINASESIELRQTPTGVIVPTGLYSNTLGGLGTAGDISLNTANLMIEDGAIVSAQSGSITNAEPIALGGAGGNIFVNASESVQLRGSSADKLFPSLLTSTTFSMSTAGNVNINTENLTIEDGANISVNSIGVGTAGDLYINARQIALNNDGNLNANTFSGKGGNIGLDVEELLLLGDSSQISTNAFGLGDGGDISINSEFLILAENSGITANAERGQGGNIRIATEELFTASDRQITADSEVGIDGNVNIEIIPNAQIVNNVVKLPDQILDKKELIVQNCRGDKDLGLGNFTYVGRGGLPPNPLNYTDRDTVLVDLGNASSEQTLDSFPQTQNMSKSKWQPSYISSSPITEAKGWLINSKGNVVLIAESNSAEADFTFSSLSCSSTSQSQSQ